MKDPQTAAGGYFGKTAWSTVLEARADEAEVRQSALERLFGRYRKPIICEIQARRRCHEATAEDLAHDFIAVCLHRDFLRKLDPQQGRFRSFIHQCLTNFLHDEHRRRHAGRRGGGADPVSLNETDGEGQCVIELAGSEAPPYEVMDRAWADQVVEQALARLEGECEASRHVALFQALKAQLGKSGGEERLSGTAARLGMSEDAVKTALHRLRKRFGMLVREEVRETVANPDEWQEELVYLRDLVGRQAA